MRCGIAESDGTQRARAELACVATGLSGVDPSRLLELSSLRRSLALAEGLDDPEALHSGTTGRADRSERERGAPQKARVSAKPIDKRSGSACESIAQRLASPTLCAAAALNRVALPVRLVVLQSSTPAGFGRSCCRGVTRSPCRRLRFVAALCCVPAPPCARPQRR